MQQFILATARDLFTAAASAEVTLDEVAATAGVKRNHLNPYVTDIEALRQQFTSVATHSAEEQ
jgi:AcrR family transcriptional regulator